MDRKKKAEENKQNNLKKQSGKKKKYLNLLFDLFSPGTFFMIVAFSLGLLFSLRLLKNTVNFAAWVAITSMVGVLVVVFAFVYSRPDKNLPSKSVGYFDLFLISFEISFIVALVLSLPYFKLLSYGDWTPFYVMAGLTFVSTTLFAFRWCYVNKHLPTNDDAGYLVIKDLIEDRFPLDKKDCVLKDVPVNYDLLNREFLVRRLEGAIKSLANGGIIAIDGKWGSGKTTLLKYVLDEKVGIPYDILDIWNYSDERALFTALVDDIYKKLDIGKDNKTVRTHLKKYISAFLSSTNTSFLKDVFDLPAPDYSIINVINDYLENNNKRVVIVVDNLDRATAEFIMFVYKMVSHLSKIKNVVFICVFDSGRTKKILDKADIPASFLEKVFSITIKVSNPNKQDIYSIAYDCLDKYFAHYYDDEYKLFNETDKRIVRLVINQCDNLRSFIVLFNALSNVLSSKNRETNLVDSLAAEFIKTVPALFDLISGNPYIFVTCQRSQIKSKIVRPSDDELRVQKNTIFEDSLKYGKPLFRYYDLLEILFPEFDSLDVAVSEEIKNNALRERASRQNRIYSGYSFFKYFEEKEPQNKVSDDDLKEALSLDVEKSFANAFDKIFDRLPVSSHYRILTRITKYISFNNCKINKENLLWYMFTRYYWFSDYPFYKQKSPRSFAVEIICNLLEHASMGEAARFVKHCKNNSFEHLVLMNRIYDGFGKRKPDSKGGSVSNYVLNNLYEISQLACMNAFTDDGFNPYSESFYDSHITEVLMKYDKKRIREHIIKHGINSDFVPAFLNDFVQLDYKDNRVYYTLNVIEADKIYRHVEYEGSLTSPFLKGKSESIIRDLYVRAPKGDRPRGYTPEYSLNFPIDNPPTFNDDFYGRSKNARTSRYKPQ